ncbi:MAG: hypothetical protein F7C35_08730 [Desulfurococcales archaeon]|nr:hypothetical protein [Desulfurococcales archaeon]
MHSKIISRRAVLTIFLIIIYTIVAAKVYIGGVNYLSTYYNIIDRPEPDVPLKNIVAAVSSAENIGHIRVHGNIEMLRMDSATVPKVGDTVVIIQNGRWSTNKTGVILSPETVQCMIRNSRNAEVEGVALYWYVPGQGWVKVVLAEDITLHGASNINKCLGALAHGSDARNLLGYNGSQHEGGIEISLHLVGGR